MVANNYYLIFVSIQFVHRFIMYLCILCTCNLLCITNVIILLLFCFYITRILKLYNVIHNLFGRIFIKKNRKCRIHVLLSVIRILWLLCYYQYGDIFYPRIDIEYKF